MKVQTFKIFGVAALLLLNATNMACSRSSAGSSVLAAEDGSGGWSSTTYLSFDGTRMAFHPRLKGVLVRLDSREKGIVIWDGGYKTFDVSDISTSWVYLDDASTRIKRTDTIGYSHGVNAIAVEFE